ncbi:hypothetical protein [Parendozoicomonas haliclonae]|uniref:Uncharacterized protein n=1 Tax=Parendozoicomonas haliclonae TaxID=1960125 RepID=A0A1X7ANB5_9GAMM|nr:hypothetical protein [Parendozoicomonas haliclonae]SMA49609.1 hypothetical protein EHSB41UT_03394 [Parendozoicomonas haliclonae]
MSLTAIPSTLTAMPSLHRHRELMEHWYELQVPSQQQHLPEQPRRWLWRDISPLLSAAPFLATLPSTVHQGRHVWNSYKAGLTTQAAVGAGRLAQSAAKNTRTAQGINEGLFEMFMAEDKYRQAQIEADYKEALAQQERGEFHFLNSLSDATTEQAWQQLMIELASNILAKEQATQSLIIKNL